MNPTELALRRIGLIKQASALQDAVGQFSNATFLQPLQQGTPVERALDPVTKITGTADMAGSVMTRVPAAAKFLNAVSPASAGLVQKLTPYAAPAWAASMATQAGAVLADPRGTTSTFNAEMNKTPLLGRAFAGAGNPPLAIASAGRRLWNLAGTPLRQYATAPAPTTTGGTRMRSFQSPQ